MFISVFFEGPLAPLFFWLGGVPVDRRSSHGAVEQIVAEFERREHFVLGIAPDGTRQPVSQWKTGFYHIAVNAKVPILLGYIDASKKEAGLADFFEPSGDIEADMPKIQAFYATKQGINPENA